MDLMHELFKLIVVENAAEARMHSPCPRRITEIRKEGTMPVSEPSTASRLHRSPVQANGDFRD